MERRKTYLKRSADGRFFLFKRNPKSYNISLDNKTKLWLSSDFLYKSLVDENKINAEEEITNLIKWNEVMENYDSCKRLNELYLRYS